MFVNTEYFREAALDYKRNGYYTNAPAGTREWEEYWDMHKKRSLHGYSVGGIKITGYNYWYLNFSPIKRLPEGVRQDSGKNVQKVKDFPAFYDGDFTYFWVIDIARHGISEEKYNELKPHLLVDIKDLSGGNHIALLKARRKGFSYKHGSMLTRNYHLIPGSKGYAMAFEKEFLDKDGLLTKTWELMNFVDNHTPFRQPRLINRGLHKQSGYKRNVAGTDVERGYRSEIIGVTLKDDPNKARGKEGELIFFEEAGKLPGLQTSWQVSRPSVEDGAYTTGQLIAFGTGGTEGENIAGLEELIYNPEAYRIIPVNNQWDEGADGTSSGFFFPDYWNFPGFMDKDGNSDIEGAKAYLEEQREITRKTSDSSALTQFIGEHPFNIMEATTQASNNLFPIADIQAHLNTIKVNGLERYGVAGVLNYRSGKIGFTPKKDAKPIMKYPHSKGDRVHGSIVIYQSPYRDSEGNVPKNMYIAVHDPYAHDQSSDSKSLGATYIFKRNNRLDLSFSDNIVAAYVGRPETLDEYNRNMFMLAEYYNAKIAFENDRGNVYEHARRTKQLGMLQEQFDVITPTDDGNRPKKSNVRRKFGIHMTERRKGDAEIYVRDWLMEVIGSDDEGNTKLRLHNIFDVPLLQELIKYNKKGNFDRVSALFIGMYYLKELHNKNVVEEIETPYEDFFLNTEHFL